MEPTWRGVLRNRRPAALRAPLFHPVSDRPGAHSHRRAATSAPAGIGSADPKPRRPEPPPPLPEPPPPLPVPVPLPRKWLPRRAPVMNIHEVLNIHEPVFKAAVQIPLRPSLGFKNPPSCRQFSLWCRGDTGAALSQKGFYFPVSAHGRHLAPPPGGAVGLRFARSRRTRPQPRPRSAPFPRRDPAGRGGVRVWCAGALLNQLFRAAKRCLKAQSSSVAQRAAVQSRAPCVAAVPRGAVPLAPPHHEPSSRAVLQKWHQEKCQTPTSKG